MISIVLIKSFFLKIRPRGGEWVGGYWVRPIIVDYPPPPPPTPPPPFRSLEKKKQQKKTFFFWVYWLPYRSVQTLFCLLHCFVVDFLWFFGWPTSFRPSLRPRFHLRGTDFFFVFFTEFLPSFCAAVLSHSSLFALPQCKKKREKKAKKKNFLRCGCPFIALSIVLEKEIWKKTR